MAIYKNENGTMVKYAGGSATNNIDIDEELSSTSKNPVANKTITTKINTLESTISNNTSKITSLEGTSHTHDNTNLLNALSYSGGKLYYNGTPVSTSVSVDNSTIGFNSNNQTLCSK